MQIKIKHPAKYSKELMPHFSRILYGKKNVLDPFAGTGKLREIVPNCILLEVETEWASIKPLSQAEEIPQMKGTLEALDNLTINNKLL